jgi:putative transposase
MNREPILLWCIKFGAIYTRRLKRKHRGYGDTFYIDEVFVKINDKQHYLWRFQSVRQAQRFPGDLTV